MRFVIVFVCLLFLLTGLVLAQKKPEATYTLKLEDAKLAPVSFAHSLHSEQLKIECKTCHHKETDLQNVQRCDTCHLAKEPKGGAAIAKDAYHKTCVECHKKEVAQGKKAPTKCTECHKK
jgi:hypothetical protein